MLDLLTKLFVLTFGINFAWTVDGPGCIRKSCILDEWSRWSECSVTCGSDGISHRDRAILEEAQCGGGCHHTRDEQPCNSRCCPEDCQFTPWSEWAFCSCSNHCDEPGSRMKCHRRRHISKKEKCGGYCEPTLNEQQCGLLCCHQDCVEGEWQTWGECVGECGGPGVSTRSKKVLQKPKCGGKQCDDHLQIKACQVDCCPVDCFFGEWSIWSECDSDCGMGSEWRSRLVEDPKCGGKECPSNSHRTRRKCDNTRGIDCKLSPWGAWSECIMKTGDCGDGTRTRDRTIVVEPKCNGKVCDALNETIDCTGPCCKVDCEVTEWSEWGHCSTECGKGISERTRTVSKEAACNGTECPTLLESNECEVNEVTDCSYEEWGEWSECSENCGKGTQFRKRKLITPKFCGGECEKKDTEETQDCESYSAKTDCKLSEWEEWGECVRNCEKGVQTRTRTIAVSPACDGKECDELQGTQDCHEKCEQLCNQGVCSCNSGFKLLDDNYKCSEVVCEEPVSKFCPDNYKSREDCQFVSFDCPDGNKVDAKCTGHCRDIDDGSWQLRGETSVTCQDDQSWTETQAYCIPPNKKPLQDPSGVECTADLVTAEKLDYNKQSVYQINTTVQDLKGLMAAGLLTITLEDINDPPTDILLDGQSATQKTLPEDSVDVDIATLSAEDIDSGQTFTFTLEDGGMDVFEIQDTKLKMKSGATLDYASTPSYTLTLKVVDSGSPPMSFNKTITIEVEDINAPPTALNLDKSSVPENSDAGYVIGEFSTEDPDNTVSEVQTFTYVLTDNANGKFKVEGNKLMAAKPNGECEQNGGSDCAFNFESEEKSYTIEVSVTDSGTPSQSATFKKEITVDDVNDQPYDLKISAKKIMADAGAGTPIGQLSAVDDDAGQTFTYAVADTSETNFAVSPDGAVTKKTDEVLKLGEVYKLLVDATDSGEPPKQTQKNVAIITLGSESLSTNITSADTSTTFEVNKPEVTEHSEIGSVAGTIVTTTDETKNDLQIELHFKDMDDDDGYLKLDSKTDCNIDGLNMTCKAKLLINKDIDYNDMEVKQFKIMLHISDGLGVTKTDEFDVLVKNKNEAPTVSDADLNYENEKTVTITVKATDQGGLSITADFTVAITDINEKPSSAKLSNEQVPEMSPIGTEIGQLAVEDPDNAGDAQQTFTFKLTDDAGGKFALDGNTLKVNRCNPDYASTPSYTLTLKVVDSGSPPMSFNKTITIEVEDINAPPTALNLDKSSVSTVAGYNSLVSKIGVPKLEYSELMTLAPRFQKTVTLVMSLVSFSTEDPDNTVSEVQTFTYVLTDNANGKFKVEGNKLMAAKPNGECEQNGGSDCAFNFESGEKSYTIEVSVTDSGTPSQSATFKKEITVDDVNDQPYDLKISAKKIMADAGAGTPIGELSAVDDDAGQTFTYAVADTSETNFAVSPDGAVTKKTDEVLKLGEVYKLLVDAKDSGEPPKQTQKNVAIITLGSESLSTNITSADTSTTFEVNKPEVIEHSEIGSVAGTIVTTTDETKNDLQIELHFKDMDDDDGYLKLDSKTDCNIDGLNMTCKAKLLINKDIDYNDMEVKQFKIMLHISDGLGVTKTDEFDVLVKNKNEAPTEINYSADEITVSENFAGKDLGEFHNADLNYENEKTATITVKATDQGGLSITADFTVAITDINEKPSSAKLSNEQVPEMSPIGTEIGQLAVEDPDNAGDAQQTFTFKLTDDAGGKFALDGNTLKVNSIGADCATNGGSYCDLDFEEKPVYNLTVQVTDSGDTPQSAEFPITVRLTDMPDPAKDLIVQKDNIPEKSMIGKTVATFAVKTDGNDLKMSYAVTGETTPFRIEKNLLKLASSLDYETKTMYNMTVTGTGPGSPPMQISRDFAVIILDSNEPPHEIVFSSMPGSPDFPDNQPVVDENLPVDTLIGQLVCQDDDQNENIVFSSSNPAISIQESKCLQVVQGSRCTAEVRTGSILDYENHNTIDIDFTATDKDGLQTKKKITLKINDKNDAPTDILFNGSDDKNITVGELSNGMEVANLTAVDVDANDSHTFSIVDGPEAFLIAGNKLKITSGAKLAPGLADSDSLSVMIRVTDSGQPPLSTDQEILITVDDVNEPPESVSLSRNKVPENCEIGFVVGKLSTTDPDNVQGGQQTFTYKLNNDAEGRFSLVDNVLSVAKAGFDFSQVKKFTVNVESTDNGSPPLSAAFDVDIEVTDANDPPTNLQFSATEVEENLAVGTVVGDLSAEDRDTGQKLSYTLAKNDYFTVKSSQVVVNGHIDFEQEQTLSINVTATDSGTPALSVSAPFKLQVVDVNESPLGLTLNRDPLGPQEMIIQEDANINDVIGTVVASDPDAGETLTFKLDADGNGVMKLDEAGPTCEANMNGTINLGTNCSIKLVLARILNFETDVEPLTVNVVVQDKGSLSVNKKWTFTVNNANEPPTDIILDGDISAIPENDANFVIGALTCIDDDANDTHKYHILTMWDTFKITKGNVLGLSAPLDYESSNKNISVQIRAMDNGEPELSFVKTFHFDVLNVNEKPTDLVLSHTEVSNDAPVNTTVGLVTVTDPDNGGPEGVVQQHTCSVGGTGMSNFEIDDTLALKVSHLLPLDVGQISLTVTCTDNGSPPLSLTKDYNIVVDEKVLAPKTVLLAGPKTVPENVMTFDVGELSVISLFTQEPVEGTFMYTVSGFGTPFAVQGSMLKTIRSLDYEQQSQQRVTVVASGTTIRGENVRVNQTFTITVLDENEPPYHIGIYGGSKVAENSPVGTIIGDLNTQDFEKDQTYNYTILNVVSGFLVTPDSIDMTDAFELNGRTLKVKNPKYLDYETNTILTLQIRSVDSGTPPLSYDGVIHIVVEDMNEPPMGIVLNGTEVQENSPVGERVGSFIVLDPDVGQTQACQVTNSDQVPFKVDEKNSLIVSEAVLDHETANKYVIQVKCSDDGNGKLEISKSFVINVTDVNEPPNILELAKSNITENNVVGQIVSEIKAVDPDNQKVVVTLIGDSPFTIVGDNTLAAAEVFDFEINPSYTITIRGTDPDGLFTSKDFNIQILDDNEPPSTVTLDKKSVKESAPPRFAIGTLRTVDPDRGQTFSYSLAETGTDTGYFTVREDVLLVGDKSLDYERTSSYPITITSTDSGTPPKSLQVPFTIEIINENEAPTDIILGSIGLVSENATARTVVTVLHVDDPDTDQTHSCSIVNTDSPFGVLTDADGKKEIVLIGTLNYESQQSYQESITCSDGEFSVTKNVTISILDVNEAPTDIAMTGSHTISADAVPEFMIGRLSATDPDLHQTHVFSVSGPNSDIIKVRQSNELTLVQQIPREQLLKPDPTIKILVRVADNGLPEALTYSQTFTLPITNIQIPDEDLPDITIDNQEIPEDSSVGTTIGLLHPKNVSFSDDINFQLIKNPENLFSIKDNSLLVLAKDLSTVTGTSRQVTIQVENKHTGESASETITILIVRVKNVSKAMCLKINETVSKCQCDEGFTGDGYYCADIDDCLISGEDSEIVSQNPCQNGGSCVDGINKYSCICPATYFGPKCEIHDTASTCVDKHLTYLCHCTVDRFGLECQYFVWTCMRNPCSGREFICVPFVDEDARVCVHQDYQIELVFFNKLSDTIGKPEFTVRLVNFIKLYGRIPIDIYGAGRSKRAASQFNTVQVYVVDTEEQANNTVDVHLIVLDRNGIPYNKVEILEILRKTCIHLRDEGMSEELFCPGLERAALRAFDLASTPKSLSIPAIAAIAGGIVLLLLGLLIIAINVICGRRQRNERDEVANLVDRNNSTNMLYIDEPYELGSRLGSRRSSGYSSFQKQPVTPPVGSMRKVRLLPEMSSHL
ncbi:hypothetical protein ScPMuIL_014613 [Solemya velum]